MQSILTSETRLLSWRGKCVRSKLFPHDSLYQWQFSSHFVGELEHGSNVLRSIRMLYTCKTWCKIAPSFIADKPLTGVDCSCAGKLINASFCTSHILCAHNRIYNFCLITVNCASCCFQVFMLRKLASNKIAAKLKVRCYVCSLSTRVVVYKVGIWQFFYQCVCDKMLKEILPHQ
jgi:Glutamine amidotransferases class-II